MQRILQETKIQEEELEKKLKHHVTTSRTELETKLEKLEVLPTKLRPVLVQVRDLANNVNETCMLAEKVSSKVKALDRTRFRLQNTQKRVEDILEVQNCITGIDSAMESENWELSCNLFKRYLSIVAQEEEASKEAHQRIRVLEKSSAKLLEEKLKKLQDIIKKKADEATTGEEVKRFCQLYTPLGIAEEGLKKYIMFIRSKLKEEADDLYLILRKSLAEKIAEDKRISCTDAITSLFETVANYAQEQIPIVSEAFGEEHVMFLLKELQQQCDVHAPRILERFQEKFSTSELMERVIASRKKTNLTDSNNKPSANDLEEILDGMAALSQRSELYNRFMRAKASQIHEALKDSGKNLVKYVFVIYTLLLLLLLFVLIILYFRLLHESMSDRSMQTLLDQYIIMEHYFMEESVNKAILLNSQTKSSSVLQSSLVDHVFFLLRRCLNRSLYTYNPHAVSVVCNYISQTLSQQLKDELMLLFQVRGGSQQNDNVSKFMVIFYTFKTPAVTLYQMYLIKMLFIF